MAASSLKQRKRPLILSEATARLEMILRSKSEKQDKSQPSEEITKDYQQDYRFRMGNSYRNWGPGL